MSLDESDENAQPNKKRFSLNLRMIPCKITYLLWGGITGTYSPYLNVFFVSIGLTTSQAGFMTGIRLAASSIANPLWGLFADYTGRRKLVIFIMCLGSVSFVFPMPWIAKSLQHGSSNHTCFRHNNVTNSILPDKDCINNAGDNSVLFYVLVTILTVGAVFVVPLPGYLDTIAMNVVKTGNTKASYGGQRIFGSFGFSIANSLSGLASDHYHHADMSQYTPVFYIFLCYVLAIIPLGCYLLGQANFEVSETTTNENNCKPSHNIGVTKHLWMMIKKFDVIFFLITIFISGLAMNTTIYFTLLLVKDEMPTTKARMSLVLVIGSMSNMVMFPFTSKVIKRLGGPSQGIILAISTYFIRYMVMSYTTTFWIMVSIQVLHGICFALAWSSMMEHVHKIAPKEILLTVFMMLSSIHFGICGLIANIVGGKVYEVYGGRALFRSIGILCGVWAVLMVVYYATKHMKNRKNCKDETPLENNVPVEGRSKSHNIEMYNDMGTENPAMEINEGTSDHKVADVIQIIP